jgi:methyl-accepting chemotaxis protein
MSTAPALLQTAPAGGSLAVAADVAIIVVAIALVIVAATLSWVLVRTNRLLTDVRSAAERSFGPVSDRAKIISNNLEFVTQAIRTDVEQLNGSVRALTDRLHSASEHMEERIDEFNALMEVVQGEAEELFLDTASTVRGVREGARAISTPSPNRARRGVDPGREPPLPEPDKASPLPVSSDADGVGAAEQ